MGRADITIKEKTVKETEGNPSKENENNERDIHWKSFEDICSYIENIIIDSKEVHLTRSTHSHCKMFLIEIGGEEFI